MNTEQNEFVGPIPQAVLRTTLVRVGIVVICAACVGLVYWSLKMRLQPVNRELQAVTLELSQLSDSVQDLQMKGETGTAGETRTRFNADQTMLFDQPEQFRAWQTQIHHKAKSLALEAKVTLGHMRPDPDAGTKLAYTPASIEITPLTATGPDTNAPVYHRVVRFLQALADGEPRCDLVGLTAEGNSNSVQQATAVALLLTKPKEAK